MQSIPDSCFIAPDSLFFAKILDADKSLSDADARSVAENYLEAEAPLALEQMMWCFWRAGGKILICAASAERVAAFDADAKRLETAKAAFPLMAAVFAARLENGRYFYKSGGGASSFSVENGEVAEISVSDSAPGAGEAGL
ncbi:MAG: hypothetical protein J6P03_08150, partial [Opitutales bacterium]|nr:hypothetical protein [Opitutales bacterium]